MFSRQLFRPKLAYMMMTKNRMLVRPPIMRFFSTGAKAVSGHSETIIENTEFYTPSKSIDIEKGHFTVFDNKNIPTEMQGAPYEVKETVIKNSIGIITTFVIEGMVIPMMYIPSALFALNMFYQVSSLMSRAVDQVELMN